MSKKAYVLIDVEKGEAGSVAVELNHKPGILAADVVFGPHDVVAVIEASDVDQLIKIVRDEITAVDYVVRTDTLLVVSGY
jgi:DNA-binding Lrp family transcriptional regulator